MTAPTTIPDAIEANALGPKRVQVGNTSVEQHSVDDQIKADQHTKATTAGSKNHLGLRFVQLVPPGAG